MEGISKGEETSWIMTQDLVISSSLFCLSASRGNNATVLWSFVLQSHILLCEWDTDTDGKHEACCYKVYSSIDIKQPLAAFCWLLFMQGEKKSKLESHMVYEAISGTEAIKKKENMPMGLIGKKNHLNWSRSGSNTFKEMQQMESRITSQVNLFLKHTMSFRI